MICLGFELADRRQRLDRAAVRWWDSVGRPHGVRRARSKWNWQLIAVKELGVAAWIWLGGRDSSTSAASPLRRISWCSEPSAGVSRSIDPRAEADGWLFGTISATGWSGRPERRSASRGGSP